MTIGTSQRTDYLQVSAIVVDVAALQDDVGGIDGQIGVIMSTAYVREAMTEAIDDLPDLEF